MHAEHQILPAGDGVEANEVAEAPWAAQAANSSEIVSSPVEFVGM